MRTVRGVSSRRSGVVEVDTALLMALVLLVGAAAWATFGGDLAQGVQAGGQDIQAVATCADAGVQATSQPSEDAVTEGDASSGRQSRWLAWLWSKIRHRFHR